MSSKTTRSGRSVKPVSRMIAEGETSANKESGLKPEKATQVGKKSDKSSVKKGGEQNSKSTCVSKGQKNNHSEAEKAKIPETKAMEEAPRRGKRALKPADKLIADTKPTSTKNPKVDLAQILETEVTEAPKRAKRAVKPVKRIIKPTSPLKSEVEKAQIPETEVKEVPKRGKRGVKKGMDETKPTSPQKSEVEKAQTSETEVAEAPRRGKRAPKPVKRMIAEIENTSPQKPSSSAKKAKLDAKKSPVLSKRQQRARPAKKADESNKKPMVEASAESKNDSDDQEISFKKKPIYMKSFSPMKKTEDPYEDSLENDDPAAVPVKKKKKAISKKKPRKQKAQMILAFDSSNKSQVAQALKRIKNLKTPVAAAAAPVIRKIGPPSSQIHITSSASINIQPKTPVNESLLKPSQNVIHTSVSSTHLSPQAPPSMVVEDDFIIENMSESSMVCSKKYLTPAVSKHRGIQDRKASTPRQEIPTKKELLDKCFGFDDSTDSDADQTRESLVGFSPVIGKSNHIMVTPMTTQNPREIKTNSTTQHSKPMRFEFKMPRVKRTQAPSQPPPPPKAQKSSFKVTSIPSSGNVDVSIFDDPYDAIKDDLNPLEMMLENQKKKPLKTVTNTAPTKTKQSLLYDQVDGQKQLKSRKKPANSSSSRPTAIPDGDENAPESSPKKTANDSFRTYSKPPLSASYSKQKPNEKEREFEDQHISNITTHFSEIDDFDLSFN